MISRSTRSYIAQLQKKHKELGTNDNVDLHEASPTLAASHQKRLTQDHSAIRLAPIVHTSSRQTASGL